MSFNPNELILEKIRVVEEYDPATKELTGRYTQIEEPSLKTSAEGTQVTDAMGSEIATFYHGQTGTFSFSNSLFSLDLAASQFGTDKEVADSKEPFIVPVSEIVEIKDNKATLKYTPYGEEHKSVKYAKIINQNNTFGKTYEESAAKATDKFVLDGNTLLFNEADKVQGKVFVQYEREADAAVKVTKATDGVPKVKTLIIHAIFHDPCDTNTVYAGVIYIPRAQINPESVEISLKSDGKHAAEYKLQKSYCEDGRLFDIIVTNDEPETTGQDSDPE